MLLLAVLIGVPAALVGGVLVPAILVKRAQRLFAISENLHDGGSSQTIDRLETPRLPYCPPGSYRSLG